MFGFRSTLAAIFSMLLVDAGDSLQISNGQQTTQSVETDSDQLTLLALTQIRRNSIGMPHFSAAAPQAVLLRVATSSPTHFGIPTDSLSRLLLATPRSAIDSPCLATARSVRDRANCAFTDFEWYLEAETPVVSGAKAKVVVHLFQAINGQRMKYDYATYTVCFDRDGDTWRAQKHLCSIVRP